jgi:hypothetical protein
MSDDREKGVSDCNEWNPKFDCYIPINFDYKLVPIKANTTNKTCCNETVRTYYDMTNAINTTENLRKLEALKKSKKT